MNQIFKSIIGRKTYITALFLEIVIVTIIGWIIIEPVAVNTSIANIPSGYDHDRLVQLTISTIDRGSPIRDESVKDDQEKSYRNLLQMIRQHNGVERATITYYQSFEAEGRSSNRLTADSSYLDNGIEDLHYNMSCIEYLPDTDFFATFGIKDADGKPFIEPENHGGYIISHSVAKLRFPTESPIGKEMFPPTEWRPTSTVVGVTADMPYAKGDGRIGTYYIARDFEGWSRPHAIMIRLGEGVNPYVFIDQITAELGQYRSGNLYLTHPVYMSDQRKAIFAEKQRSLTQKWIIVAFFLINVLLGVAGTFYVQSKTRIPEAGVMRAFGATRSLIIGNIVGEAILTTAIGWLIGSALYILYLKTQGFPMEMDSFPVMRHLRPMWYDTPLSRYTIIGATILCLLLAVTALGAWLPARRVGHTPIITSLRDE